MRDYIAICIKTLADETKNKEDTEDTSQQTFEDCDFTDNSDGDNDEEP